MTAAAAGTGPNWTIDPRLVPFSALPVTVTCPAVAPLMRAMGMPPNVVGAHVVPHNVLLTRIWLPALPPKIANAPLMFDRASADSHYGAVESLQDASVVQAQEVPDDLDQAAACDTKRVVVRHG